MDEEKTIDLTLEDATTISTIFYLAALANKRVKFLHDEELVEMEFVLQKLRKVFFPEEYNKTLH